MGKRFLFIATCITSALLLATSCLEKNDVYVKIPADQYFDFDLNQKISLSVEDRTMVSKEKTMLSYSTSTTKIR